MVLNLAFELLAMATGPRAPSPAGLNKNRTVITIATLIGILSIVILLAFYGKSQSPRRRLDNLQLQSELRRSGYRQRREKPQERGIEPSLLQSIPAVRYHVSLSGEGKGRMEAQTDTRLLRQSPLSLKTAQVRKTEVGEDEKIKLELKEEDECSICSQAFVQNDCVRILPCGHMHHQRCIDRWLLAFSGTCPVWQVNVHGRADISLTSLQ